MATDPNVHCVNCASLRMEARVRAGSATPLFLCPVHNERRTHLMPGPRPTCLTLRTAGTIVDESITNPEQFNERP